ncbi:MAG: carboxypeptidase regulatory-like domain-containing protein [Planctomycetaceae bacterium]|nr:carboxypeptidase regulatory-like domain-containing protein [Planctomycetaceae bacterium]
MAFQVSTQRSLLACASVAALALGCGDSKVALYPVSGQVLFQGKPAENALIVLHDSRPAAELRGIPIPRATTDGEGRFRLSSYSTDAFDGAPAGSYVVTIVFPEVAASVAQGEDVDPEAVDESPDKLRGKYASPDTSPLKAEIKEGENVLPTFDVS